MAEDRPPEPTDPFDLAYAGGITHEEELPTPAHEARHAALPHLAIAAGEPLALKGCVIGPLDVLDPGFVVIGADGNIAAVQADEPVDARVLDTGGVILPGLIDLHGHPDFNIFAAWEPPITFINRMQWRGSDLYHQLVRDPWNQLSDHDAGKAAARYAEVRSLVGGTTAIQGASPQYPSEEALVRNVDKRIFGAQIGRSMVDLDERSLGDVLDDIEHGTVKAFYIHAAEGQRDNQASHNEFGKLVELKGLTEATVIIHGTALSRDELTQIKDVGAKLVWSPQSNLRLYQQTTAIADILDLELPFALGADWLPSGSRSLLDELRVARREIAAQGATITAERLVRTVTQGAADIAGLGDKLGRLEAGRPADILVLERHEADPFENVLAADPSWVELVTIAGDLSYGRSDWITLLGNPDAVAVAEPLIAWGKPMILDTTYAMKPHDAPPRLAELRKTLIDAYPNVGPIFA